MVIKISCFGFHRTIKFSIRLSSNLALSFALLCSLGNTVQANQSVPLTNPAADMPWHTEPLATSNRNPLIQIYGLPSINSPRVTKKNHIQWRLNAELMSVSSQNLSFSAAEKYQQSNDPKGESLVLDSEIFRSEIAVRFGLTHSSEVSISLPYISHNNGFTDSAIESWHDGFNLPNGNRDIRPTNELLYKYQRDGQELLKIDGNARGIGDLQIHYQQQLKILSRSNALRHGTVQVGIKIPTGDESNLTGSGSTDISTHLSIMQSSFKHFPRLAWHGSAGILWMSDQGLLNKFRKEWVYFGNSGVNWRLYPNTSIKLQVELHSNFYNSSTREIGKTGGQLVVGGSYRLSSMTSIDFYFSEDILIKSSPDVSFGIAIRRRAI